MFFWAPLMKWCLVAAGVKDLKRSPEKLSVSQNVGTSEASSIICQRGTDCLFVLIKLDQSYLFFFARMGWTF